MSTVYGTRVPLDELKILLDANSNQSFPGTGSTVFDLSGNQNNYNIYGTVPRITQTNYNNTS